LRTRCLEEYLDPKRNKVTGSWRKFQNKELQIFTKYSEDQQIKKDEISGA
jgi:hypothetical protein